MTILSEVSPLDPEAALVASGAGPGFRPWVGGLAAGALWLGAGALTAVWPGGRTTSAPVTVPPREVVRVTL